MDDKEKEAQLCVCKAFQTKHNLVPMSDNVVKKGRVRRVPENSIQQQLKEHKPFAAEN